MPKEKKEIDHETLKVKAYNLKIKNIKKVKDLSLEKDGGNESKALNRIIEKY